MESGEQVSDALRGNEALTPGKMMPTPYPVQEVGGQYPTKPFTPPAAAGPAQQQEATGEAAGQAAPTPMELAGEHHGGAQGEVSQEQLQQQSAQLQKQSSNLNQMLMERYPSLSDGQKSLVGTKLNKYQSQTTKAGKMLGVNPLSEKDKQGIEKSAKEKSGGDSTLTSFLSMITGGDTTLRGITHQLAQSPEGSLNPIAMMRAQGALASASQSVNFATAVIGQGLSFVKTIMQTQI